MNARRGALVLAAVVGASLLGAVPAAAREEPPRTAFEVSGGAAWTTLEQEQQFLADVDARSDRVSITELARTPQGRPIQLVQIGERQRTPDELADGSTGLLLCLQHGDEPAARESCLITLRNLAFDDGPEVEELLSRSSVLVVPTANPDGRAADTRTNSQDIDVNRDHLALVSPEARAVAELLNDYDPDLVVDVHEYSGTPGVYDRDLIYLWPRNLNVDERLFGQSRDLGLGYVEDAVAAAGFSTGIYGIENTDPPNQVAGDEDERIFRNLAGLRHRLSLLTETYIGPTDTTADRNRRVDSHVAAQRGALDMLADRGPALDALGEAAEDVATDEGRGGVGPFYFGGADNDAPEPEQVVLAPPCAYSLTGAQLAEVDETLELHGIDVTPTAEGATVSMAQPARGVIPLLLDGRATHHVTAGAPVACG